MLDVTLNGIRVGTLLECEFFNDSSTPSIIYKNGLYHKWYIDNDKNKGVLKHAVSFDGIKWFEHESDLYCGHKIISIDVIYTYNRFIAFYIENYCESNILILATSLDGVNWVIHGKSVIETSDINLVILNTVRVVDGKDLLVYLDGEHNDIKLKFLLKFDKYMLMETLDRVKECEFKTHLLE